MKILHFIGSFLDGGIENLLINVVNRQAAQSEEVAIMIGTTYNVKMFSLLDNRIKVIRINKPIDSKNPWYLIKIICSYHAFKPDVLHLHSPGVEYLFPFKPTKEHRVVTIHNETIKIPFSSTVDQYIAISQCVKDSFIRQTGHDNCVICYNGIDVERFALKQHYFNKPQKLIALGRILFSVKAQDLIVKAFSNVRPEKREQMTLDIWGDGKDFDALRSIVLKLGLEKNVSLVGNVSNNYVTKHLCDYDMIICASHHEGLGIAAIEAMAAGVPVLLSDALGFVEVTDGGKFGKHFAHSNETALTAAIENAYQDYTSMCNTARSAVSYAKEKFSINNYVSTLLKLYSK